MIFKRANAYLFLVALVKSVESHTETAAESVQKDTPFHYYFIAIGGIVLLLLTVFIYWQDRKE
jgi:hypothetical protein